jgi:selenocysteine lyase/cysteine desulfurase
MTAFKKEERVLTLSQLMLESLKQTIMRRDNLTAEEADERINEAREWVAEGSDPEEILYEEFGLEPDYIFDLLD